MFTLFAFSNKSVLFSNGGMAKENRVSPSPFEIAKSPNLIISIPINISISPPIFHTAPLIFSIAILIFKGNNKLNNATSISSVLLLTPIIVVVSTIVNESSFNTFGVITV